MDRIDLRRLPEDWTVEDQQLLEAVEDASATPIYIDYKLSRDWFDGIKDVIDQLEAHVAARPAIVLVLIERLLVRLDVADLDDSGGGTALALDRLRPLYAEAGRAVGEEPAVLAQRVADLALDFDFEL